MWTHEINISHCDTDTFTNEVSGLKCDQKYIQFKSNGLPASDHILMEGIIATNQQFPTEHSYQFKINRKPKQLVVKKIPDAGPIGVAVNGIPIFDPATQGPADKRTGKRPSTLDAGELDECGGHAGRGDDYHYHIAPNCLIEQLGMQKVEIEKKPIGFSMDGHPIHALGWFNKENDVESKLDKCRGMTDLAGNYFYNVKATAPWGILDCFNSEPRRFAKDKFDMRLDSKGREVTGCAASLTGDTRIIQSKTEGLWPRASEGSEYSIKPNSITISEDDNYLKIKTNNLPDHILATTNPNCAKSQSYTFKIPKKPKRLDSPRKITKKMQVIGVAVNGVVIAGPFDSQNKIAPYNRVVDQCASHADPEGMYHYHFAPTCLKRYSTN